MSSYPAGEIGAYAFIAGVMALMSVSDFIVIAGAAGVTIYSLYEVLKCANESGVFGYDNTNTPALLAFSSHERFYVDPSKLLNCFIVRGAA